MHSCLWKHFPMNGILVSTKNKKWLKRDFNLLSNSMTKFLQFLTGENIGILLRIGFTSLVSSERYYWELFVAGFLRDQLDLKWNEYWHWHTMHKGRQEREWNTLTLLKKITKYNQILLQTFNIWLKKVTVSKWPNL